MTFNTAKFLRSLFVVLLLGILIMAGVHRFTDWGKSTAVENPADLVVQAREALEAVKRRQPGDRRPASYDAVMAPLDKLLSQANRLVYNVDFDPVGDYQKLYELTNPVIEIATDAHRQAQTETGPLAKEFRFNQQKAEAIQYLVSGMYDRMVTRHRQTSSAFDGGEPYPASETTAILSLLDTGLDANPDSAVLYYQRGVLEKDTGLFAAAARDIERSLEIDPENVEALNTLHLVHVNLKQFDKAEEALEKARALITSKAKADGVKPGEEYTTIVFNLARFHEGLAAFYARENRMTPTAESNRLATRHSAEARKYFLEFLEREPPESEDARLARRLIEGLPG